MSTSLLYHGFGICGYRYLKTEYIDGKVIFHLEQPRDQLRCSADDVGDEIWAIGEDTSSVLTDLYDTCYDPKANEPKSAPSRKAK